MNVRELIQALKGLPPDAQIVMAKDPEGNGFHDLEDEPEYDPETTASYIFGGQGDLDKVVLFWPGGPVEVGFAE